jgi:hypothetical protein
MTYLLVLRHGYAVSQSFRLRLNNAHSFPFIFFWVQPWLLGTGHGRYKTANAHLDTVNPSRCALVLIFILFYFRLEAVTRLMGRS